LVISVFQEKLKMQIKFNYLKKNNDFLNKNKNKNKNNLLQILEQLCMQLQNN